MQQRFASSHNAVTPTACYAVFCRLCEGPNKLSARPSTVFRCCTAPTKCAVDNDPSPNLSSTPPETSERISVPHHLPVCLDIPQLTYTHSSAFLSIRIRLHTHRLSRFEKSPNIRNPQGTRLQAEYSTPPPLLSTVCARPALAWHESPQKPALRITRHTAPDSVTAGSGAKTGG